MQHVRPFALGLVVAVSLLSSGTIAGLADTPRSETIVTDETVSLPMDAAQCHELNQMVAMTTHKSYDGMDDSCHVVLIQKVTHSRVFGGKSPMAQAFGRTAWAWDGSRTADNGLAVYGPEGWLATGWVRYDFWYEMSWPGNVARASDALCWTDNAWWWGVGADISSCGWGHEGPDITIWAGARWYYYPYSAPWIHHNCWNDVYANREVWGWQTGGC